MADKNLRIAILSGKGGTGKTLLSVNLAAAALDSVYVDCDVEEPNGHLFFKPQWDMEKEISVKIPQVDQQKCDGCKKCVEFCNFNALAYVNGNLKIFDDICHSCGGCSLVCPQKALTEKEKTIGTVSSGYSEGVRVISGIMDTGIASGIPIIKELLSQCDSFQDDRPIFIDCPPGSACIVMESIKDADYCLLAAEPTIFGRHNLELVWSLVRLFKKPYSVVINKCVDQSDPTEEFCKEKGIKILGKIPFDSELGTLNSNGEIATRKSERYKDLFSSLLEKIYREVSHETAAYPER
ncbi:MAG: 4Fe-4S binding protein [Synergistaceae bacterium]|nr:4Fe-4S binding protein [Synergistaceae bacterium]